jgi:folate-binding protein YgfZ
MFRKFMLAFNTRPNLKSAKAEACLAFRQSFSCRIIHPTLRFHDSTMASRALRVPLQRSNYVCDSCWSSPRSLRIARVATTRAYTTTTSRNCELSPRRAWQLSEHNCRPTALRRRASVRYSRTSQHYSTDSSAHQHVVAGTTRLPHRRLVSLSGPDAAKFLHGLITNNVDSTRLSPFYAAFLDARGRILWDVFVWVWPELVAKEGQWACYIEVDAGEVEALKKHLKRHKLRSKLAIKDVPADGSEGIRVWAAWGGAHEQVEEWSEIAGLEDPRAPGMFRYITNADRETIARGVQPVDAKYYHIQRYIHGVPEGPEEISRESSLPMEANVDLNGGIDFKKGCYVGQELTIRTKHTGVVRKRVLPIRLHSDVVADGKFDFDMSFEPQPSNGTDIKALDDNEAIKKGRAVGKIVAAIGNVGLATCRIENMTSMRVSAEGGTYKPGMQFGVDIEGQLVKVEPVLHDWFVRRKETLWDREDKKKAKIVADDDELD